MIIWCLHGSLQTVSVWNAIGNAIESEFGSVQVEAVNLYENEYESFGHWRQQFYKKVEKQTKGGTAPRLAGLLLADGRTRTSRLYTELD